MLDLHYNRLAVREAAWPNAGFDFLNGVIGLEGYGFNLNSSMKFTSVALHIGMES